MTYSCRFCTEQCGSFEPENFNPKWVYCGKCGTLYLVDDINVCDEMMMECIINDKRYQLQIDFVLKSSRIVILPENFKDTIKQVIDLPFIVTNVNPDNLANKIKTSITFS